MECFHNIQLTVFPPALFFLPFLYMETETEDKSPNSQWTLKTPELRSDRGLPVTPLHRCNLFLKA